MRSGVTLSTLADGNTFVSCSGDTYNIIYSPVLVDGCIDLVESGREDIATMINSYADKCDMSLIMARLAAGDASPLYARQAFYGDFSNCTYDHAAMLQQVVDAHNYFDRLPDDVKSRFHDSFQEWFSTAGSPEWAKSMTISQVDQPASSPVVSASQQVDQPASSPVVSASQQVDQPSSSPVVSAS